MRDNPSHPQGLVLVGLRGTGKTSVGRILAARLGWPFADADVELEKALGRSIRDLFEALGESTFRDWEERVLSDLTGCSRSVLATGGGAVLRESNRRTLRRFGFVVWLSAEPAALAERLTADPRGLAERPALTPAGTLGEIAALAAARAPLYREVADLAMDTTGLSPAAVATAILEAWPHPRDFMTHG